MMLVNTTGKAASTPVGPGPMRKLKRHHRAHEASNEQRAHGEIVPAQAASAARA